MKLLKLFRPVVLLTATLMFSSCKKEENNPNTNVQNPKLTSSMFVNSGTMPKETGKNFGNTSPDLKIENIPSGTVEMVLTMRDKSFNDSWHWAIWDIPKTKTNISKSETWGGTGATIGQNDYGTGYVGPFPPEEHKYEITIFFLNQDISLAAGQYKNLPSAIQGKIISQVTLTGFFNP